MIIIVLIIICKKTWISRFFVWFLNQLMFQWLPEWTVSSAVVRKCALVGARCLFAIILAILIKFVIDVYLFRFPADFAVHIVDSQDLPKYCLDFVVEELARENRVPALHISYACYDLQKLWEIEKLVLKEIATSLEVFDHRWLWEHARPSQHVDVFANSRRRVRHQHLEHLIVADAVSQLVSIELVRLVVLLENLLKCIQVVMINFMALDGPQLLISKRLVLFYWVNFLLNNLKKVFECLYFGHLRKLNVADTNDQLDQVLATHELCTFA